MTKQMTKQMTIIDKIIEAKIALNVFQASHIANGLKLAEMENDEARLARCKLYRDWRNAGEKGKTAYEKAIAAEAVPAPMFPELLHTEELK